MSCGNNDASGPPVKKLKTEEDKPFNSFSSLISPLPPSEFFEKYWEKNVLHIPRAAEFGESLFSVKTLFDFLKEKEAKADELDMFRYGVHLNVTRCVDGVNQEMHNKDSDDDDGGIVLFEDMEKLWNSEKCTVQFFQPQRYMETLWKKMSLLEEEFDSLWGANVYLTPPESQGLAPHFDDVEVFVLQTEGMKEWTIHESIECTDQLAMEPSRPLPKNRIGKVLKKVTLSVGDLLYLPRGTIHSAKSCGGSNEPSVHITFSTYQRHSVYDFMSVAANRLIDAIAPLDINFRRGVPIAYRGTGTQSKANIRLFRNQVATALHSLADSLEKEDEEDKIENGNDETNMSVSSELNRAINESLNEFTIDFIKNRLPPFNSTNGIKPVADKAISMSDEVAIINPNHLHYFVIDDEDVDVDENEKGESDEVDEIEEKEDRILRIYHSLENDRKKHMGGTEEGKGDISMNAEPCFVDFLGKLVASYPGYVTIPSIEVLEFVKLLKDCNMVVVK